MRIKVLFLFFISIWFFSGSQAQTVFFVSPNGSDQNVGSMEKPFATLAKAQFQVRKTKAAVMVYFREGTYYLSGPIVFTPDDSRNNDQSVIYRNFENEKVVINGSTPLKLNWENYKNSIKRSKVPPGLIFDQLFINSQEQRMARYPNYNPNARFLGGTSADAMSKSKADT